MLFVTYRRFRPNLSFFLKCIFLEFHRRTSGTVGFRVTEILYDAVSAAAAVVVLLLLYCFVLLCYVISWSGAQKLGTSTTLSIFRMNILFLVREMSVKVIDVVEIPRV